MDSSGQVYKVLAVLIFGLLCFGESLAHTEEHPSDQSNDAHKRAFGSLTKPTDERTVPRLFLGSRPGSVSEIEPIDMKRQSYDGMDDYYLGGLLPPEVLEDYYNDVDNEQDTDYIPAESVNHEENDAADDDDENIEKRPFGINSGRIGKRQAEAKDIDKRPFGSLTGLRGKRPFGSLTGRYKRPSPIWGKVGKRPAFPMWGRVGKRPSMPMWGRVGKRPAPMWGKIGKRPSLPMWGKVGKRRIPMWGKIGKRSVPSWGEEIDKRPSSPIWGKVGKRPMYGMWGKVGKRPFGPMRSTIGKKDTSTAKRPFVPIHGVVG